MSKTIKLKDNRTVTVVTADSMSSALSEVETEMDTRAKAAVESAIQKAITCKKPIARYDRIRKRAYIVTKDGVKIYV